MSRRAREFAAKNLARILKTRTDPHGYPMNDEAIIRGLEINDEGVVRMWLKPRMAHCPCCLHDLQLLMEEIANQRGVSSVRFDIVDIPGSDEWNNALSSSS